MEQIITPALVEGFRAHLVREERSGHTVEKYLRDLRDYAGYLGARNAGAEATRGYKEHLQSQSYATGTVNSVLASLNAFFKFAGWSDCKTKRVRTQPSPFAPEDRDLSRPDYDALLGAARRGRHRLIVETIAGTGIRVSELAYITVEAARNGKAQVTCKNKTREILIDSALRTKLLDYAEEIGITSGPIFLNRKGKPVARQTVWAMLKRLARRARVAASKVFPHNLRKLFAKSYYAETKDVVTLAAILGHGSMETTRIYLKTPCEAQRGIIDRLGLVRAETKPEPRRHRRRGKGKRAKK